MNFDELEVNRANVSLKVYWQDFSGKFAALITEIGNSDCYVECSMRVKVSELIDFKVKLPNGLWIPILGKIKSADYPNRF